MYLTRTDDPTDTVLALAALKAHLGIETSDYDALLQEKIDGAVEHLDSYEGVLGLTLATQSWRLQRKPPFMSRHFDSRVRLPLRPVQSVDQVQYIQAGATLTLDPAAYRLAQDDYEPWVALNEGYAWPAMDRREDALQITFTAGYPGADGVAQVPRRIVTALLLIASDLFTNRESQVIDARAVAAQNATLDIILRPLRRPRV